MLGQTINIRAEKDSKKIKEMTAHEKKIRAEWFEFKSKQKQNNNQRIVLSNNQINDVLSKLFG